MIPTKQANTQRGQKPIDGRSFQKMRGFEQLTKSFRIVQALLLLVVATLGVSASAQSLNPIPWP
ncbi:MAG TPA: hypothetical protein VJW20_11420, partial [Candidatus Angelobacter sp.]|nr:hypothetical protein [Candidatus Angelobacter sp.]